MKKSFKHLDCLAKSCKFAAEKVAKSCKIATNNSLHYYDKNSKQELDFIIEEQNKITVIEVKSGEKYKKHASLDAAVKEHADKIHRSIVLSRYNVSKQDGVLYLPLYMTIFI
jgi:hypothetical protein